MARTWSGGVIRCGATAALILVAGQLGTAVLRGPDLPTTAWWPPTGIALVLLVRSNRRWWPAIILGSAAGSAGVALLATRSLFLAGFLVVAAALSSIVPACAVVRGRPEAEVRQGGHILRLSVGAVAGVVPAAAVVLAGFSMHGSNAVPVALSFSASRLTSIIVLAPLLLVLPRRAELLRDLRNGRRNLEWALQLAVTAGVLLWVFLVGRAPLNFLLLLPLMWGASRLGALRSFVTATLATVVVTMATLHGRGALATIGDPFFRQLTLQLLLVTITIGTVAAVVASDARARSAAELKARELLLVDAQRLAQVGSWHWDIATGKVSWSREMYRIFGVEPATFEVTMDSFRDLIHPADRTAAQRTIQAGIDTGVPYDMQHRLIRPNGEIRTLRGKGRAEFDAAGAPISLSGTGQDVTDALEVAAELARARDLFAGVLNAATEQSIIAYDTEGVITVFNNGAEQMLGYRAIDVVGRANILFIHDDQEVQDRAAELGVPEGLPALIALAGDGVPDTRHWTYVTRDGRRREVVLSITSMRDAGVVTGYIGLAVDVTERQILQAALRTSEEQVRNELIQHRDDAIAANRAKSAFLANTSHEVRTPMNGVLGLTELLLGTDLDAEQRSYAETVQASGRHLMILLDQVLDLAKIEAGKVELEVIRFDLRAELGRAMNPFRTLAAEKGIDLCSDVGADAARWVAGDPTRFSQVVTNLVSNALKFTTSGSVTVRLRRDGQDMVRVEVADTGLGIRIDSDGHLFEAFTQADETTTREFGGTGLGLAISRELARLMGGDLTFTSVYGEGSTFVLRARLASVARSDDLAVEPHTPLGAGPRLRILLAEDNRVNQLVATAMLRRLGHVVDVVADGRAAVHAALTPAEGYDVVLMDCQMPVLDGYAATVAIRRAEAVGMASRVPILALTASAMTQERAQGFAAGMDDYLTKPITLAQLDAALSAIRPRGPERVPAT